MSEPIHIISLGAGVQSSTMALMAAAGEITPMPVAAIFADTQAEPKSVYTWLDWLEKQLPFPVHRVTAGSLDESATVPITSKHGNVYMKTGLPVFFNNGGGIAKRQCTEDFKIIPIRRKCRELRGRNDVVQWIGISLDESLRMKPSRDKWCENRWPLIELEMNRRACLAWMESKGHPKPTRSACRFCPFKSDHEWRLLRDEEPQEFAGAVNFEIRLQSAYKLSRTCKAQPFLHRSGVALSEVDFSTEEERGQLNMFNNECEGMCGV